MEEAGDRAGLGQSQVLQGQREITQDVDHGHINPTIVQRGGSFVATVFPTNSPNPDLRHHLPLFRVTGERSFHLPASTLRAHRHARSWILSIRIS